MIRRHLSIPLKVLALGMLAIVALAPAAGAVAAKFHSVSSSVNGSGALVVSFDQRGLGTDDVNYRLTATANATWACINGGGKNPSAANKRSIVSQVSQSVTLRPKNGRIVSTITSATPSAGSFTCPSGQRLTFVGVSYTNIVLTDTTNGVSTAVPNASRTFLNI